MASLAGLRKELRGGGARWVRILAGSFNRTTILAWPHSSFVFRRASGILTRIRTLRLPTLLDEEDAENLKRLVVLALVVSTTAFWIALTLGFALRLFRLAAWQW